MAKKSEARLGKGLAAIFGDDVSEVLEDIQQGKSDTNVSGRFEVAVEEVRPNPYQPRKSFDDARLQELAQSIRQHGVFTPILVKKSVGGYELIAGHRRKHFSTLPVRAGTSAPASARSHVGMTPFQTLSFRSGQRLALKERTRCSCQQTAWPVLHPAPAPHCWPHGMPA